MNKTRSVRAVLPAPSGSLLAVLDDNALARVLLAAKDAHTLGLLASSSRQLCRFARSRVPVHLAVMDEEHAGLVIKSHTRGLAPFSGCIHLRLRAAGPAQWCMAVGVLGAAQQWPALDRLALHIFQDPSETKASLGMELCASSILSGVLPLQRLRRLELAALALGACSAHHILQLTQLTFLHLSAAQWAADTATAAADLGAMSAMTNLVQLRLNWALAPHLPAGPEGPYCLPSSLVKLQLDSNSHDSATPMACWVAHLPGCHQLQELELYYGPLQHASAHPNAVVALLAQHNKQLRRLDVSCGFYEVSWGSSVAGLPYEWGAAYKEWRPDAALAALTGLECLSGRIMEVTMGQPKDWQHLAQMPALSKLGCARVVCVPEPRGLPQPCAACALVKLFCSMALGGREAGVMLLACPNLQQADVTIVPAAASSAGARLLPHPKLEALTLRHCEVWGSAAAAAAQFAALAPVLSGVITLQILQWPHGSSRAAVVMPDMSPCTALKELSFSGPRPPVPQVRSGPLCEQEHILSMVSPLTGLQRLWICDAPRVNARVALVLQSMLPQLQRVELINCGKLLHVDRGEEGSQADEGMLLQGVRQLLRADLQLVLGRDVGWCGALMYADSD